VLLFALCYLPWLAAWASPSLQSYRSLLYSAALAVQYGAAALFVARLEARRESHSLRALCAVMALQAVLPFLALLHAAAGGLPSPSGTPLLAPLMIAPSMLAMLFTVYLCLALTHERTDATCARRSASCACWPTPTCSPRCRTGATSRNWPGRRSAAGSARARC
jgi:uncharacterized membrane protein